MCEQSQRTWGFRFSLTDAAAFDCLRSNGCHPASGRQQFVVGAGHRCQTLFPVLQHSQGTPRTDLDVRFLIRLWLPGECVVSRNEQQKKLGFRCMRGRELVVDRDWAPYMGCGGSSSQRR